jgi:hypothetical protein
MEKFAVFGVDSVGIAHSERAAGPNGGVDPGLLAFWHFGPHHVAGLKKPRTDLVRMQ